MGNATLRVFGGLAVVFATATASAGTMRYELPQLLGDYALNVNTQFDVGRSVALDTPFGFYSISKATIVVAGSAMPGKARGDGINFEASEFELIPRIDPGVSPILGTNTIDLVGDAVIGDFRIEKIFAAPFAPTVTPLPNPDGYPPIFLSAGVSLSLNGFRTSFPPIIGTPPSSDLVTNWFVVDLPITANITEAYLILEGPGVVPEPSTAWMLTIFVLALGARRSIRRRFSRL